LLCQRNDQIARKQKEAPVPTIIVEINDINSDLSISKYSSLFFGFDPRNGNALDGRLK
jgi:hypothetical protein